MKTLISLANLAQDILDSVRNSVDMIGSILLRAYLAPVFWLAANNKWNPFDKDSSLDSVIGWFGEGGLGLPFPALNAYMAWGAEYFGAICLALGLGTRWISVPLMVTMLVAMATVHWQHGWQAVHDLKSPFASENAEDALDRLSRAKSILEEHGNIDWLTEHGSFLVSNNGIEWAATYFVLLLALFFLGGGKIVSLDYWIAKKFRSK
ncbi:MAG: putative oxidoreductase [Gammaproteobacteria bacterium]|jgi:putative oxidoreductase